ncbi:MAG: LytR C-terminal domain-containing protein [Patescibacteria group bacterium]|nr:LytR C-terminal domain-containing protein [Patescibacteria group bacterium]
MLYIDFNDTSVESIQTNKSILGGEKIVSCARHEISDGLIINGLIVDPEKLKSELKSIFASGYPRSQNDKQAAITISDKQVITHRFPLDDSVREENISDVVIDQAKKILPYDPSELDNFYRIVNDENGKKGILYTATAKNTIAHFAKFLLSIGVSPLFISSRSFAVFELVKDVIGDSEKILYSSIDKKTAEYIIYDKFGPVSSMHKKLSGKGFATETRSVLADLEKNHDIHVSKMVLNGIESMELHASELSEALNLQTLKMGDFMESVLQKEKLGFESGGIPKMLLSNSLGLIFLSRTKSPPNFARDVREVGNISEPEIQTAQKHPLEDLEEKEETAGKEVKEPEYESKNMGTEMNGEKDEYKSKPVETASVKTSSTGYSDNALLGNDLTQYQRSGLGKLFVNKMVRIILILVGIVLVLGGLFTIFRGKKSGISLPFVSSPTPTPIPTVMPSLTPTPTINPNLKRSDLKVSVENGTEKTGYAGDIATYLEGLGYKNVAKSNADNQNYDKSVLQIKDGKKDYLPLIKADLKDKIDTSTVESLSDSSKYDVVVVLGKN